MVVLMTLVMLAMSGVSQVADEADQEPVRQAVETGEVLPLRRILERVERGYPGQVMEVETQPPQWRVDLATADIQVSSNKRQIFCGQWAFK